MRRSLRTIGVREGDKVTIAMPNCPQAIYMFYAVNLAGAVANMVHPLSSEKELEFYINESESVHRCDARPVLSQDRGHPPEHLRRQHRHRPHQGRAVPPDEGRIVARRAQKAGEDPRRCARHHAGTKFMQPRQGLLLELPACRASADDPAADPLLRRHHRHHQGHPAHQPELQRSRRSQIIATNPMFRPGDKMLSAMPLFHGFGLGVCIHSMLCAAAAAASWSLASRAESYAKLITKYRLQLHRRRARPCMRRCCVCRSMEQGGPELPQGRVFRRRLAVRGAEEEVGQVPVRPQVHCSGTGGLRHYRDASPPAA